MKPLPIKINGNGFTAAQLIAKQVCLHCLCVPNQNTTFEMLVFDVMGLCGGCYETLVKADTNSSHAHA